MEARRLARREIRPGSTDPQVPVLRVNALEAWCFARWIDRDHGNLPTAKQWERAAGKGRVAVQIYRNPDAPLNLKGAIPDVAIDRMHEGPLEVARAPRDITTVSLQPEWAGKGCRDMAGDGIEWTRDLEDNQQITQELHVPDGTSVYVRGRSYNARYDPNDAESQGPWNFHVGEPPKDFRRCYPTVGFRVVVEP